MLTIRLIGHCSRVGQRYYRHVLSDSILPSDQPGHQRTPPFYEDFVYQIGHFSVFLADGKIGYLFSFLKKLSLTTSV